MYNSCSQRVHPLQVVQTVPIICIFISLGTTSLSCLTIILYKVVEKAGDTEIFHTLSVEIQLAFASFLPQAGAQLYR